MKKYILFILFVCFLQSCGSKRVIYNYEDDRKEIPVKKKKTKKKKKVKDKKPIIPVIRTTEDYIAYYSQIAMDEMKQYKIPASITLAQGILESGSGKGRLAVKANNHFGIKCHKWTGETFFQDDDKKNECFRKYGFWPKNGKMSSNKYITISILQPIDYGMDKDSFIKKLQNNIYSELDNLN